MRNGPYVLGDFGICLFKFLLKLLAVGPKTCKTTLSFYMVMNFLDTARLSHFGAGIYSSEFKSKIVRKQTQMSLRNFKKKIYSGFNRKLV